MRVLVVEDEKDLNRVITRKLKAEGYSVDSCFDGADALDYMEMTPYDVIVMDIMMPVMNGYEAAKMIRSLDREDAKVIPIIAMTANAFIEDRMRAKEAGMDEHISKPVDAKLLVKVIYELAEHSFRGIRNEKGKKK